MRKLLMVLFLFGTISVFCNAQIDGYYVKDSGNLALFADGEPRTSNSIGIEAGKSVEIRFTQPSTGDFLWQKMSGSDYIQFGHRVQVKGTRLFFVSQTRMVMC